MQRNAADGVFTKASRFYYGWVIVGLGFVSMALWFGIRSTFSVFYVALLDEFPWSRAGSAGVQSMAFITYTFLAPLVGGLIDRLGPRRVIIPGILVLSLGLALCGTIKSLPQFYLLYGVLTAAGVTCIGIVSYSAILAHWFEEKRGLASGIAVSGMGVGTFLLVPISQDLISAWGWRMTFVFLGGLILVILLPLSALFLRHKPEELGLLPDGRKPLESTEVQGIKETKITATEPEQNLRAILRKGAFWALMGFIFLGAIGAFIVLVHNVKFLVDEGISPMTAAFVFALTGIISSVFRILWGWLSDRIGREKTYSLGMLSICLGVATLLLLGTTGRKALIYPFFVLFGIGWGATAPMFMAAAADLFTGKAFGLIYGLLEGAVGVGAAFGAWVAGFIFDTTGSYDWAFVLAIAVFIFSGLLIWVAAPRKAFARLHGHREAEKKA